MKPVICLATCCCTLLATASHAQIKPLSQPEAWAFGDKSAWSWTGEAGEPVLSLTKQSDFKPEVRSPFNLGSFDDLSSFRNVVITPE